VNIRFKDAQGKWSSTVSSYFYKIPLPIDNRLVAYEYWINDQYDQKYSGSIDNQKSFVLTEIIDCSLETEAINTLYFRCKDVTGKWSSVLALHFDCPGEDTKEKMIKNDKYGLKIIPNPVSDNATIEFSLPATEQVRLSLCNVLGQEIMEIYKGQMDKGINRIPFDAAKLSTGVYIISLQDGNFQRITKFMRK